MKIAGSREKRLAGAWHRRFARFLAPASALAALFLLTATLAAAQSSSKAVKQGPKDDSRQAERLAGEGDKAAAAGKLREALQDYTQAVKAAPGDT